MPPELTPPGLVTGCRGRHLDISTQYASRAHHWRWQAMDTCSRPTHARCIWCRVRASRGLLACPADLQNPGLHDWVIESAIFPCHDSFPLPSPYPDPHPDPEVVQSACCVNRSPYRSPFSATGSTPTKATRPVDTSAASSPEVQGHSLDLCPDTEVQATISGLEKAGVGEGLACFAARAPNSSAWRAFMQAGPAS